MTGVVVDALKQSLTERLAQYKITDGEVDAITKKIFLDGVQFLSWDVCSHGICVDYIHPHASSLDKLLKIPGWRRIEVFPYGIPSLQEALRVQVEIEVPKLAGQISKSGNQR